LTALTRQDITATIDKIIYVYAADVTECMVQGAWY